MITGLDCWTEGAYEEILTFVEKHLWLFVQHNATIHQPKRIVCSLTQLDYPNLRFLQRIYFLLSEVVQRCVKESIPKLLTHLAQSSEPVTAETRNKIHGRVNWSLTLKRRLGGGLNDPTIFMIRKSEKAYDFSRMQALKYFLNEVSRLCVEVLGFSPAEISEVLHPHGSDKWRDTLINLHQAVHVLLKNVRLQGVSLPEKVTDVMFQKLRSARNVEFREVYAGLQLYKKLFVHENLEVLRDCFNQGVLKPLSRDRLYETYVLFLTLEALDLAGWQREKTQLIGYNEGAVVQYRQGNATLQIYYQTSPDTFQTHSLYKALMSKYDLDTKLRRPDLLIEFDGNRYQLLEVKRTVNQRYIADSFYKVLGYLKDFEALFQSEGVPKAILVVWDDLEISDTCNDAIIIRGRQGYRSFLSGKYPQV